MQFLLRSLMLVLVVCWLSGCGKSPTQSAVPAQPAISPQGYLTHAQPRLPTVKIWVGAEELTAEIASTELQIRTGMMFRTNTVENEGMLFVFPPQLVGPKDFYMRNCVVPLSAAYIAPDGTIAEIIELEPGVEEGVKSKTSNLQFVLEVSRGWFERHNVRTGMVIRTERGSLQETFFRR